MAVTFTGARQGEAQVMPFGNDVAVFSQITCSGTTTDNGDSLPASAFGLTTLRGVILAGNAVDSESNPEGSFVLTLAQPTPGDYKVVFHSQAVAGAATALAAITDGTTVTGYVFYAIAFGKY